MKSFSYCHTYRRMPWLRRGIRVIANGKEGHVTSEASDGNLRIRLVGEKYSRRYHPQWETVYYGEDGSVLADYRKKKEQE